MITQTDLFSQSIIEIHRKENLPENEAILSENKAKFSKQCRIVLEALQRGERLTTASALLKYGIGDLRARIRDLIKFNGVDIGKDKMSGGYKVYYLKK